MKQVKLNQFEAAIILEILLEVNRRETFSNETKVTLVHYENCTRNMILTLSQLLEEAQAKKSQRKAA
jgi:hypothetical protein